MDAVRPRCAHRKLPKNGHRIEEPLQWYTQSARCSAQCHTLSHVFGRIPMTGAYNCFIYPYFFLQFYHEFLQQNQTMLKSSPPSRGPIGGHMLRGLLTQTPSHAPPLLPPLVTPACTGSDVSGRGNQPPTP